MKNIIILSSVLFSLACNEKEEKIIINQEKTQQMKIYRNSYYTVVVAHNHQAILLVNDVPVFQFWGNVSRHGTRTSVPIKQALLGSGKHHITLKMYPQKGDITFNDKSYGEIGNKVYKDSTFEDDIPLGKVYSPHSNGNSEIKGLSYYELNLELEADLPFDIVGWRKSVDLKKEEEIGADIWLETRNFYHKIYNIIKTKNTREFAHLIKEREALLATAFYFTEEKQQQDLEDFLALISNNDFELAPLPEKPILHYYGYGKLVTMLTVNREGIIKLVNKKNPKEEIILDFYFHRKTKGGNLEVIL